MLNNTRKNHSSCAEGEHIVSYLYDEIKIAEKAGFETHLQNCSVCADEVVNFGAVRSSILEWRNEEFLSIETPVFEVPINQQNKIVANGFSIWFSKVRDVLTLKPILATAAFAVIAIFTGLALFALNVSRTNELAAKTDNKNSSETNLAQEAKQIEQIRKPDYSKTDSVTVATKEKSSPVFNESKNAKPSQEPDNRTNVNNSTVKISDNNIKTNSNNRANEPKIKDSIKTNKKSVVVPKSQMPIYSNVEDEEDKSLRLADLFDEIDSK